MFSSCSDDEYGTLTAEQERLIGKAVNFNTSIAEPFATRASYNTDGGFNENDQITIFRQYSNDNGATFDPNSEGYRVYSYQAKNVTGTNIRINTLWKVKTGKEGYEPAHGNIPEPGTFTQTEADSLTWDDGRTVRFRAWGMSNLSGCLDNGSWDSFYPDFYMSSWVTASGPSSDIPLTMRHLGCRIAITPIAGNQLQKIEICTEYEDYMREDNADSNENDEADKCSEEEAHKRADEVKKVFEKMCMPGGIDFETGLMAMSASYKNDHDNIKTIEQKTDQELMIKFNTLSASDIATKAVRPVFNNNNGHRYLITIPHDMSTEEAGKRLTLPPYTRFRIYLRDVNDGDKGTSGYEGEYHIFALDDIAKVDENRNVIKDAEGKPVKMFPDGLPLIAGYSYRFKVGYHYNSLKILADNNFSWEVQNLDNATLTDEKQVEPTSDHPYKWWKEAIDKSISEVLSSSDKSFNPVFEINTVAEFFEFIKLVNGTAYNHTPEFKIERGERYTDETAEGNIKYRWKWYKVLEDGSRGDEISKKDAEQAGYIFYHSYYPAEGDNSAYYIEKYLDAPYSFYSNLVNRKFKVVINKDLDFQDLKMATIGTESTPFLGVLDGQNHVLSNIYMSSGYLFDYAGYSSSNMHSSASGAVISNLVLQSEQPLCVVNHGKDVKILGIALETPSNKAAFGEELFGTSYLVGCINEGDATVGLVGKASDLYMYGCLQTAAGINGGALLGEYTAGASQFFAPQVGKVIWGRFMCNYFDIDRSPNAVAVGGHGDYTYPLQQYIRGTKTYILRAVEDNLITSEADLEALKGKEALTKIYGLAPWKAMNYAIYRYNNSPTGALYPCTVHYKINDTYNHRYPLLKSEKPTVESGWNVLDLLN